MSSFGEGSAGASTARASRQALEAHLQQQAEQLAQVQQQLAAMAQILAAQQQQQQETQQAAAQAQQQAEQQAAEAATQAQQDEAAYTVEQVGAGEALPRSLRLEKPPVFEGEMDGDTVSAFVHKLDLLFALSQLNDVNQRAAYAVTCLTKAAYTWYISMHYRIADLTWPTLKQDLLDNFRPMDYTYQARQQLAQCKQTGHVRGYVRAFRLKLVRCSDVTSDEALFRFVDGLMPLEQRHVRLAQPADFHQAAAIAEQLGSTFGEGPRTGPRGQQHQRQQQRGHQQHQQRQQPRGPVPMQMGSQQGQQFSRNGPRAGQGQQPRSSPPGQRFNGTCRYCNIFGHRERDCRRKQREQQGQPRQQQGQFSAMGGQPGSWQWVPAVQSAPGTGCGAAHEAGAQVPGSQSGN